MWAMIACCIALVIWTMLLAYTDRRDRKNRELDEITGRLSITVESKEKE